MRAGIAAAVAVAVVLALAGCGGSKPSATEQWQDSVCSALNEWVGQINGYADDIRKQLQSPHVGMAGEIRATVKQGQAATDRLQARLKALDAPPVTDGQTAKQLVDSLVADLRQSATTIGQHAASIGDASNANDALQAVSMIASEISLGISRAKTTFQSLRDLNAELSSGFQTVGSCKDLQKRFE